jgi:hypothetical protein
VKLSLILEWDVNDLMRRSATELAEQLNHITANPQALRAHLFKGFGHKGLLIENTDYWSEMATHWTNLLPADHQQIMDICVEETHRRLHHYQTTGQITEGILDAITSTASWIGKQLSKFGAFVAKIAALITNMNNGYGGGFSGPGGEKRAISLINARTLTTYCDMAYNTSADNIKNNRVPAQQPTPEPEPEEVPTQAVDPQTSILATLYRAWKDRYESVKGSMPQPDANEVAWQEVHRLAIAMKVKDWVKTGWKEFADYRLQKIAQDYPSKEQPIDA